MSADDHKWHNLSEGSFSEEIRTLLARIDARRKKLNWSEGYFGKRVVGDDTFVERLKASVRVQVRQMVKIEAFLDVKDADDPDDGQST